MCNPHTTALCNDSEKLFGRLSQSYVTSKNERRVNITFEFTVRISVCARLRHRTIDAIGTKLYSQTDNVLSANQCTRSSDARKACVPLPRRDIVATTSAGDSKRPTSA
jgi:hypothetical protein